jgi:CBS domain-containing protein
MTPEVKTVQTSTPFRRIVEVMTENRISGIPVVDDSTRVIGVVTEGDLVVKQNRGDRIGFRPPNSAIPSEREYARRVQGTVAGALMTKPAVTVDEDADLRMAARLMSQHRIGRLPVTSNGRLVGILSRGDVLRVFLRPDEDIRRDVEQMLEQKVVADTTGIKVDVADGVVTLRGDVEQASTATVVGFHVDRCDGVTCVVNELSCQTNDLEQPASVAAPLGAVELAL